MKLHNLKPNKGARKDKHIVGRGHAAGKGKQAGKGQSGQNKRGGTRPGFEGGQNPWFRRLPKRGFNNINHIEYQVVTLETLEQRFKTGAVVDFKSMTANKVIRRKKPVKILATGKVTKKFTVKVDAISKDAKAQIEKAGGTVEIVKSLKVKETPEVKTEETK